MDEQENVIGKISDLEAKLGTVNGRYNATFDALLLESIQDQRDNYKKLYKLFIYALITIVIFIGCLFGQNAYHTNKLTKALADQQAQHYKFLEAYEFETTSTVTQDANITGGSSLVDSMKVNK